jgi:DNA-binding XRE family transcriptional regulator
MQKQTNNPTTQPRNRPIMPHWKKVGREFRERRKRRKIAQSVAASWIGVSQRQLSLVEAGKAGLTDDQILTLSSQFEKIEKGVVLDALEFRPLNLLPENEFLSVQQTMLANWKYNDLWFLGIRHLPVLKERRYQDAWVNNLQNGTSYNLIMVLDKLMESSAFGLLQKALSEISGRLEKEAKPHKKITIYGLTIRETNTNEKGPLAMTRESYAKFKSHFDTYYSNFAEVKPTVNITDPDFDECRAILHYGWLRSVVCYEGERGRNSFAAVYLDHLSNNPQSSADGESGWTFLSPITTTDLQTHIAQFAAIMANRV